MKKPASPALPKGIRPTDLSYKYRRGTHITAAQEAKLEALGLDRYTTRFELWYSMQWKIPTLAISTKVRAGSSRTYAIGVDDKKVYRIGHGPHVTVQHIVYVTRGSFERLYPYLELLAQGRGSAGQVRDRISSRRAQGALNRSQGLRSWYW